MTTVTGTFYLQSKVRRQTFDVRLKKPRTILFAPCQPDEAELQRKFKNLNRNHKACHI
tara:strand:- start:2651 stop:2824 length:174 start_codon:yes stop_codon:yes gene_type:complete